ncbi:hypothetical protein QYE76_053178 [Lolium multiflorum]|uniref:Transposase-associated domain-containing protein n=1 Tax=Lolium multiflorum TaxID=4521 RepID=A0AAD8WJU3_LOLMU|nr:hypothetical protein QYE76_053178 [Lolium multiflorum]
MMSEGVVARFLKAATAEMIRNNQKEIRCPCRRCKLTSLMDPKADMVRDHLLVRGFMDGYRWEGDEDDYEFVHGISTRNKEGGEHHVEVPGHDQDVEDPGHDHDHNVGDHGPDDMEDQDGGPDDEDHEDEDDGPSSMDWVQDPYLQELLLKQTSNARDAAREKAKMDQLEVDAVTPLYEGCRPEDTRLKVTLMALQMKVKHKMTDTSFNDNMSFWHERLPKGNDINLYMGLLKEELATLWDAPFERMNGVIKGYVRNRARPDGSIAKGFLTEECISFCTSYLEIENPVGLPVNRHLGKLAGWGHRDGSREMHVDFKGRIADFERANLVALQHIDVVDPWVVEHKTFIAKTYSDQGQQRTDGDIIKEHNSTFTRWFKDKMLTYPIDEDSSAEEKLIFALSQGAEHNLMTFQAYDINGYTFYTEEKDMKSDYQNSGVTMESYTGDVKQRYYGKIEEIWELSYAGENVPMFRVRWAKNVIKEDRHFTTMVIPEAKSKTAGAKVTAKYEPWVLASQVDQCFFITDPQKPSRVVVRRGKRSIIGMDGAANELDFDQCAIAKGVWDLAKNPPSRPHASSIPHSSPRSSPTPAAAPPPNDASDPGDALLSSPPLRRPHHPGDALLSLPPRRRPPLHRHRRPLNLDLRRPDPLDFPPATGGCLSSASSPTPPAPPHRRHHNGTLLLHIGVLVCELVGVLVCDLVGIFEGERSLLPHLPSPLPSPLLAAETWSRSRTSTPPSPSTANAAAEDRRRILQGCLLAVDACC